MEVIIKEIVGNKELKEFIRFPLRLYQKNKFYVPPLILSELDTLSFKNPAFEFCEAKYWLAYNDKNIVVGRIAGIINHRYNKKTGIRYARFGWLDFIEDESVLKALFHTVESWAKKKNVEYIHGPLGFSDFDASGVLISGYNEISSAYGKYNFAYYPRFIERFGYTKEVDWVEFNINIPNTIPERFTQTTEIICKRYNVRSIGFVSKQKLSRYADEIFQLLNNEYESIHGFSELTPGQINILKKQYIPLLRSKYISVIINSEEKVVGFGICIPSLSKALQKCCGKLLPFGFINIIKSIYINDTIDTLLIAIHSKYRNKGLNAVIFNDIYRSLVSDKITNIETTRELEYNNKVNNLWNKFEYRNHKRARCYIKNLHETKVSSIV